jgi:hypothetical protein
MMDALTPFEHEAIATIIGGDHPVLEGLRTQLARCEVSKRRFSGVGFFTTLTVPSEIPSVPVRQRLHVGDVDVSMEGAPNGVGVVLFVDAGRLAVPEAFTYDDPWPDEITAYSITSVTHPGGAPTDMDQVEAAWVRPGTE